MKPDVCYIVILNYEGGEDTINCLDSLRNSIKENCRIIVVDNASRDMSLAIIEDWCKTNACDDYQGVLDEVKAKDVCLKKWITIYSNNTNNGFAAGNNVGLRLAMQQEDCESIFILNNDTKVSKDVFKIFRKCLKNNPNAGIFSLRLVDYNDKNIIQFNNQRHFCKYIARTFDGKADISCKYKPQFYSGAAFFVTKKFIDMAGYMDERYFLYFEELDWVMMASRCGLKIVYMNDAVVQHKSSSTTGRKPAFSQFCMTRSALLFTKKYHPICLGTVIAYALVRSLRRLLMNDKCGSMAVLLAVYCFLRYRTDDQIDKYKTFMQKSNM